MSILSRAVQSSVVPLLLFAQASWYVVASQARAYGTVWTLLEEALPFCMLYLVMGWAAFRSGTERRTRYHWIRLILSVITISVGSAFLFRRFEATVERWDGRSPYAWRNLMMLSSMLIGQFAVLWVLLFMLFRTRVSLRIFGVCRANDVSIGNQFSIRSILIITAITCVGARVWPEVSRLEFVAQDFKTWGTAGFCALAASPLALAISWAVLAPRHADFKFAFVVLGAVIAVYFAQDFWMDLQSKAMFIYWLAAQAIINSLTMLSLRLAGYRWTRNTASVGARCHHGASAPRRAVTWVEGV